MSKCQAMYYHEDDDQWFHCWAEEHTETTKWHHANKGPGLGGINWTENNALYPQPAGYVPMPKDIRILRVVPGDILIVSNVGEVEVTADVIDRWTDWLQERTGVHSVSFFTNDVDFAILRPEQEKSQPPVKFTDQLNCNSIIGDPKGS